MIELGFFPTTSRQASTWTAAFVEDRGRVYQILAYGSPQAWQRDRKDSAPFGLAPQVAKNRTIPATRATNSGLLSDSPGCDDRYFVRAKTRCSMGYH